MPGAAKLHWIPLQLAANGGVVGMGEARVENGAERSPEGELWEKELWIWFWNQLGLTSSRRRDSVVKLLLDCCGKIRAR